jgi:hypothetical protein
MARPRAADDFAAIRARMEELRRESAQGVRGPAVEPYGPSIRRSAAPIEEKEMLRRLIEGARL